MRSYKYRIYPSKKHISRLNAHIGLCQEIYNILLQKCKDTYKAENKYLSKYSLINITVNIKSDEAKFKGLYSQVIQDVCDRLTKAYTNFFRRIKEKKAGSKVKAGFPRFKKFYKSITYPQFGFKLLSDKRLHVSKIGNIPIILHRIPKGELKNMTIKRTQSNKWFVIFCCDLPEIEIKHINGDKKIGIDVGIESFATLSDGTKIENPRFLVKSEKKLKRLQRELSHKKKGSKNRNKVRIKLTRQHEKITNQRTDFIHKISSGMVYKYGFIAIEDLNIQGMIKNHCLAKHISDAGWNLLGRQLSYKASSAGSIVQEIDKFFPSSQLCSECGNREDMPLSQRTFKCSKCGNIKDRDHNSAINIRNEGLRISTVGLTGINACGDTTSSLSITDKVSRVAEAGTIHDL